MKLLAIQFVLKETFEGRNLRSPPLCAVVIGMSQVLRERVTVNLILQVWRDRLTYTYLYVCERDVASGRLACILNETEWMWKEAIVTCIRLFVRRGWGNSYRSSNYNNCYAGWESNQDVPSTKQKFSLLHVWCSLGWRFTSVRLFSWPYHKIAQLSSIPSHFMSYFSSNSAERFNFMRFMNLLSMQFPSICATSPTHLILDLLTVTIFSWKKKRPEKCFIWGRRKLAVLGLNLSPDTKYPD